MLYSVGYESAVPASGLQSSKRIDFFESVNPVPDDFLYFEMSGSGVTRRFCGRCGTPLTYEAELYPGEVHVLLGTLDRPEDFVPQIHVHVGEQLPWLEIPDGRPRYLTTSIGAEPMA